MKKEGKKERGGCERNVLGGSRILLEECLLGAATSFYGPNFLKDVQTTKLNAPLDVKERLLEYM